MSARDLDPRLIERLHLQRQLDERAMRILTDSRQHAAQATQWALSMNPQMAGFTVGELALGNYEVHRT